MTSSYLQYMCLIFDRYTTTLPHPLFTLTHILFNFIATVTALRSANPKVSNIALIILKSRLWISFCLWVCPIFFSLFYIDHNIIFCVRIITLFQHSLPYSRISCPYCSRYIIILSHLHCLFIVLINEHKVKIYCTTVPSLCMSSSYSLYTCLDFDRYTMT